MARSTNQAGLHCLLLEKHLKGEMSMTEWEKKVLQYARVNKFLSIAVADFYLSGLMTFLASILRYVLAVISWEMRNPRLYLLHFQSISSQSESTMVYPQTSTIDERIVSYYCLKGCICGV